MSLTTVHTNGFVQEEFSGSLIRDIVDLDPEFATEEFTGSVNLTTQPLRLYTSHVFTSGWNMFGGVLPYEQDLVEVFEDILGYEIPMGYPQDVILIKNNLGEAWLPEWGFNGIGDLIPGEGYQIKIADEPSDLIGPLTFPISDDYPNLESLLIDRNTKTLDLLSGWNMIGYNRTGTRDLIQSFNDCTFTGFVNEINHVQSTLPGTIVITEDKECVGTGTSFTSDYNPSDVMKFDIAGVKYNVQVQSIDSDTEMTLAAVPGSVGGGYPASTAFFYKEEVHTNTSITGSIIIVKDNNGAAYLPEWDFNGVGDLTHGNAYLIKTTEAIKDFKFADDDITALLPLI